MFEANLAKIRLVVRMLEVTIDIQTFSDIFFSVLGASTWIFPMNAQNLF